jgi:UDP-N-acetylglucosamine/UDP-N-acetylgalactosamine diphosphorylase
MSGLTARHDAYVAKLAEIGQSHLLRFWAELDEAQRGILLDDLDQVDLARCQPLIESHVKQRPAVHIPREIEPPPALPARAGPNEQALYERATARGAAALRAGRVAAFTVAGGQGTRLGFDGPKGAFPVSPIRNATLFQLFAEYLLGVKRRYGQQPRWYIMTSLTNHEETTAFFAEHDHFGLGADGVMFFQQRVMPAFMPDGRIALADKHRVALSPDGHGGSLRALRESGALADMAARGIEAISYFQVDNPLVKVVDPRFVGLHLETGSEMSSKAIPKAHDLERVGNFCVGDGKLQVIEYSDLPDELAHAKNDDGSRRFDAGSIAIHVLTRSFVERITDSGSSAQLPWHRADKKVAVANDAGEVVTPDAPNAVKLEMFVFDAIPLAANPLVLYTERAEEFSPVKNAEGDDSPATARRDMVRRAARWLAACGVEVGTSAAGEPGQPMEISPAQAIDVDDLCDAIATSKPQIRTGVPFLLE